MSLLNRWPAPEALDDLFVRHYARLVASAKQILGSDWQAAEDLVHDAFIRVALCNPDVQKITNLEGYLFVTLRNVHLSQIRRASARPAEISTLADHESAAAGLHAINRHRQRDVTHEELTHIAHYACLRTSSSKAASVLILRFFHGYHPGEIARVLQTTEPAVDARLRMARAEARAYLDNPDRLRFIVQPQPALRLPASADGDLVLSMRQAILDLRLGACLTAPDLDRLYASSSTDPLDAGTLAHVVTCAACLDDINRRLHLPVLADRHPSDTLGRGGRSGGNAGGAGGGAAADPKTTLRTRLKDALEDRPKELQITVNGLFVGSQAVTGAVSDQRLKILVTERIGFVEVFSEFGSCLLYMDVAAPPDGPVEQSGRVALSDGRRLTATLTFQDAAPLLHVVYEDPALGSVPVLVTGAARDGVDAATPVRLPLLRDLYRRLMGGVGWLRPAVTAGLLGAVIAGWIFWRSPPVSAAGLLRDARAAEARSAAPDVTTHRVLSLEERVLPAATVVGRSRVELWHQGVNGVKARRLYNERGQLIAGEWTRPDGMRTVYRLGHAPVVEAATRPKPRLTGDSIWRWEPSADDFAAVIGSVETATVQERTDAYVISSQPPATAGTELVSASLTLDRRNLQAVSHTIALTQAGQTREYRLSEAGFTRLSSDTVAPSVFEPEPVLLNEPPPVVESASVVSAAPPIAVTSASPASSRPVTAAEADALELQATYTLHRSRIWIGEQGAVERTPDGILVRVRVSSEMRKSVLVRSLDDLTRLPGVAVEIDVAEEIALDPSSRVPALASVRAMPAYPRLQGFGSEMPAEARDEAIRTVSVWVLDRVTHRGQRLRALQALVRQWPNDRLRALDLEVIVRWQAMVQEHAAALRHETELLRVQLAPMFGVAPGLDRKSRDEAALTIAGAAQALPYLAALIGDQDTVLSAAFTPCTAAPCRDPGIEQLIQGFVDIESRAARFSAPWSLDR